MHVETCDKQQHKIDKKDVNAMFKKNSTHNRDTTHCTDNVN